MMARVYNILPVIAKPHGQVVKSSENCIASGCTDFNKLTAKHYELARPMARRFGLLALKVRPHGHKSIEL